MIRQTGPTVSLCFFPMPLLVAVLVLGGCSLNVKPEKPTVMATTGVTASVEGLRSAVLGLSQDAAESIEGTADTIIAMAPEQRVKTHALEWKAISTVEYQSAAMARDPVVGLADLITFTLQTRAFLARGDGTDWFGAQQPLALETVDRILDHLLHYVDQVTPAGGSGRWVARLQPWADAHPISSPYVGRASILTDSISSTFAADQSALAAIGDIELTARILDGRIEQVQRSLLKQARWQAELAIAGAVKQPAVDTVLGDLNRLTGSVERITGVTEDLPGLITSERIAALRAVTLERMAVLEALTSERRAVLMAIDSQRVAVVEALHNERVATLADAEVAAQRLIDYTLDRRLAAFINVVLWRVFVGLMVLLLLALGVGLILVAAFRRSGRLATS